MSEKEELIADIAHNTAKMSVTEASELLNPDFFKAPIMSDVDNAEKDAKRGNVITPSYRIQKLLPQVRAEIEANYQEFRTTLEGSEEYKKIETEYKKEGYSGKVPFMCFVEMDSSGKMHSSIIVTKDSVNKTTKQDDGSYLYEEHRKTENGYESVITRGKNSFYISSEEPISAEIIERAEMLTTTTKALAASGRKMNPETLLAYQQTLKSLGIDNKDINFSDEDRYRIIGTGDFNMSQFDHMAYIIDKESDSKQPIAVSISSERDGNVSSQRFRLTNDGKYIDENSFEIRNGRPHYNLVTLDQIKQVAKRKRN